MTWGLLAGTAGAGNPCHTPRPRRARRTDWSGRPAVLGCLGMPHLEGRQELALRSCICALGSSLAVSSVLKAGDIEAGAA